MGGRQKFMLTAIALILSSGIPVQAASSGDSLPNEAFATDAVGHVDSPCYGGAAAHRREQHGCIGQSLTRTWLCRGASRPGGSRSHRLGAIVANQQAKGRRADLFFLATWLQHMIQVQNDQGPEAWWAVGLWSCLLPTLGWGLFLPGVIRQVVMDQEDWTRRWHDRKRSVDVQHDQLIDAMLRLVSEVDMLELFQQHKLSKDTARKLAGCIDALWQENERRRIIAEGGCTADGSLAPHNSSAPNDATDATLQVPAGAPVCKSRIDQGMGDGKELYKNSIQLLSLVHASPSSTQGHTELSRMILQLRWYKDTLDDLCTPIIRRLQYSEAMPVSAGFVWWSYGTTLLALLLLCLKPEVGPLPRVRRVNLLHLAQVGLLLYVVADLVEGVLRCRHLLRQEAKLDKIARHQLPPPMQAVCKDVSVSLQAQRFRVAGYHCLGTFVLFTGLLVCLSSWYMSDPVSGQVRVLLGALIQCIALWRQTTGVTAGTFQTSDTPQVHSTANHTTTHTDPSQDCASQPPVENSHSDQLPSQERGFLTHQSSEHVSPSVLKDKHHVGRSEECGPSKALTPNRTSASPPDALQSEERSGTPSVSARPSLKCDTVSVSESPPPQPSSEQHTITAQPFMAKNAASVPESISENFPRQELPEEHAASSEPLGQRDALGLPEDPPCEMKRILGQRDAAVNRLRVVEYARVVDAALRDNGCGRPATYLGMKIPRVSIYGQKVEGGQLSPVKVSADVKCRLGSRWLHPVQPELQAGLYAMDQSEHARVMLQHCCAGREDPIRLLLFSTLYQLKNVECSAAELSSFLDEVDSASAGRRLHMLWELAGADEVGLLCVLTSALLQTITPWTPWRSMKPVKRFNPFITKATSLQPVVVWWTPLAPPAKLGLKTSEHVFTVNWDALSLALEAPPTAPHASPSQSDHAALELEREVYAMARQVLFRECRAQCRAEVEGWDQAVVQLVNRQILQERVVRRAKKLAGRLPFQGSLIESEHSDVEASSEEEHEQGSGSSSRSVGVV